MLKKVFVIAVAMAVTVAAADLADNPGSLLDDSEYGDSSAFSSSDVADDFLDASAVGSDNAADEITFPPETQAPLPPVSPPVVDGVKMFGQCGGIFYAGNTACADSDAYCKELSVYSSICSPRPVK